MDDATLSLCAQWGRYRHPSMWPPTLTVSPNPIIHQIISSNAGISLSSLLIEWKKCMSPTMADKNIDMLNFKAYIRCFPMYLMLRRGRVDFVYFKSTIPPRHTLTNEQVVMYMRSSGLDCLLFAATRDTLEKGDSGLLAVAQTFARFAVASTHSTAARSGP